MTGAGVLRRLKRLLTICRITPLSVKGTGFSQYFGALKRSALAPEGKSSGAAFPQRLKPTSRNPLLTYGLKPAPFIRRPGFSRPPDSLSRLGPVTMGSGPSDDTSSGGRTPSSADMHSQAARRARGCRAGRLHLQCPCAGCGLARAAQAGVAAGHGAGRGA